MIDDNTQEGKMSSHYVLFKLRNLSKRLDILKTVTKIKFQQNLKPLILIVIFLV